MLGFTCDENSITFNVNQVYIGQGTVVTNKFEIFIRFTEYILWDTSNVKFAIHAGVDLLASKFL